MSPSSGSSARARRRYRRLLALPTRLQALVMTKRQRRDFNVSLGRRPQGRSKEKMNSAEGAIHFGDRESRLQRLICGYARFLGRCPRLPLRPRLWRLTQTISRRSELPNSSSDSRPRACYRRDLRRIFRSTPRSPHGWDLRHFAHRSS